MSSKYITIPLYHFSALLYLLLDLVRSLHFHTFFTHLFPNISSSLVIFASANTAFDGLDVGALLAEPKGFTSIQLDHLLTTEIYSTGLLNSLVVN